MVDVEFIKLRCGRDGWSIRESARRTGWSRQAIRKALAAPAAPPSILPSTKFQWRRSSSPRFAKAPLPPRRYTL